MKPIAGSDERRILEGWVLEIAAHPDEGTARVERLPEDLEQRRTAFEGHQHVPVDAEILFATCRVEQACGASYVQTLLAWGDL